MALRALHRSIRSDHADSAAGVVSRVSLPASIDGLPRWDDVVHLCGFEAAPKDRRSEDADADNESTRMLAWFETAPATLGPHMRILLIGVNPSPTSAVTGIPFARGGNRFWPGLLGAGLGTVDRDPEALLRDHGIGMADISKRVSVRADELTTDEVRAGWERLDRIAQWLQPGTVAVLGITTYRIATGVKKATLGWQAEPVGGCPVYVMPNPSGLNAHTSAADMSARFREASEPPR